jgi:hypothetical protein
MYHHGYVSTGFDIATFINLELAGLLLLAFIAGGLLVVAMAVDLFGKRRKSNGK